MTLIEYINALFLLYLVAGMYFRFGVCLVSVLVSFGVSASSNKFVDYYVQNEQEARDVDKKCDVKVEALLKNKKLDEAAEVNDSVKCKAARYAIAKLNREKREKDEELRKQKFQASQSELLSKYEQLSIEQRSDSSKAAKALGIECNEAMGCRLGMVEQQYVKVLSQKIEKGKVDVEAGYEQCLKVPSEENPFASLRGKSECDLYREQKVVSYAKELEKLDFKGRLNSVSNCDTTKRYDVCEDANERANKSLIKSSTLDRKVQKALGEQCIELLSQAKSGTEEEFKSLRNKLKYMYECYGVKNTISLTRYK